jgi:hypothetical protein
MLLTGTAAAVRFAMIENRIIGLLLGVGTAVGFFAMANDGASGADSGRYLSPIGIFCLLMALAGAVMAVRGVRLGLVVDARRVRVHNLGRSYEVPLAQLASIDLVPRPAGLQPRVVLVLRDGTRRSVNGLDTGLLRHNLRRVRRRGKEAAARAGVPFHDWLTGGGALAS